MALMVDALRIIRLSPRRLAIRFLIACREYKADQWPAEILLRIINEPTARCPNTDGSLVQCKGIHFGDGTRSDVSTTSLPSGAEGEFLFWERS